MSGEQRGRFVANCRSLVSVSTTTTLQNCYRCGMFSFFFWGIGAFREDACSLRTKRYGSQCSAYQQCKY
jgi:hypothetical protein